MLAGRPGERKEIGAFALARGGATGYAARVMEPTNDLMKTRLEKRQKLLDLGIDPYGGRFEPSETVAAARANPVAERDVRLAGRLLSHRDMGKSLFCDIKDATGKIQIYVQKKVLGDEQFELFKHLTDLGDILGITGKLFLTHAGELLARVPDAHLLWVGDGIFRPRFEAILRERGWTGRVTLSGLWARAQRAFNGRPVRPWGACLLVRQ